MDDKLNWSLCDEIDCLECGEICWVADNPKVYEVSYLCSDPWCDWEGGDDYWDLYGCMSVPYGFT